MISCLMSLIVACIIVLVALWIIETIFAALGFPIPARILLLLRLLAALWILLYALGCLGVLGLPLPPPFRSP